MDWIGQQPFLVETIQQQIQSVFLAAPEVPEVTWVRLFCARDAQSVESSWGRILAKAIENLKTMGIKKLAALGSSAWFINLLSNSSFSHSNDIVMLEMVGASPPPVKIPPEIEIRLTRDDDLRQVYEIDQAAFKPLWQNSVAGLARAISQHGFSTVAEVQGQIVGYQISTCFGIGHLARLAVHPEHQGKQVASALVSDLFSRFASQLIAHVTVNTQADNWPSLAIYQKFGFQKTGEVIPVFERDI
jgi:ribosomal protein S18 acetylase RimI-like enzyme